MADETQPHKKKYKHKAANMGNLLGAPVTEKETHVGVVIPGEIEYGLSSMQGWRVHMEDAHIAEPSLYAIEPILSSSSSDATQPNNRIIPLPGHSLFAVFDGHGGAFAARYSGRNACRVLSKEPKFVQYAKCVGERLEKQQQQQAASDAAASSSTTMTPSETEQQKQQEALSQRSELNLLEGALRDAFVELDKEIAMAQRRSRHPDADKPYHMPYHMAGFDEKQKPIALEWPEFLKRQSPWTLPQLSPHDQDVIATNRQDQVSCVVSSQLLKVILIKLFDVFPIWFMTGFRFRYVCWPTK